jgi:peroxiredoxin
MTMGESPIPSLPTAPPRVDRDLAADDLDREDAHGRIGYGRFARFTPLGLALLLIGGLLTVGIARSDGDGGPDSGPRQSDLPGRPAPAVTLPLLDGGEVRLADLGGSVVVVNFWATWCEPCKDEMPALQRIATAGEVEGIEVTVLGVGSKVRDTEDSTRAFLRDLGITYPVARDSGGDTPYRGAIGQAFGQQEFVPMTVIVRPDGIVAAVHYGPLTENEIRSLVIEAGG